MNRMTYKEFEKKITWIEFLLKREAAKVKCDEKISDPDNPEQKRQIDVTIRRGKLLTIVECRLHSRPQNVKWIEELHGRRASLNAYSVMAVSSSGFTKGAIKKAVRLGVVLRDFKSLTEEEIRQWGVASSVYLEYISFFDTILHIVTEPRALLITATRKSFFRKADGTPWPLDYIFKPIAKKLSDIGQLKGSVRTQMFTKHLFFGGVQIKEIIFQSNYIKRKIPVKLPVVSIYGKPKSMKNSEMIIESQKETNFEIYRHKKSAFLIIDFSAVPPMDRSVFIGIIFDFKRPVAIEGIKIIGQKIESFYLMPFKIKTVKKDSILYHSLLTPDARGPILIS